MPDNTSTLQRLQEANQKEQAAYDRVNSAEMAALGIDPSAPVPQPTPQEPVPAAAATPELQVGRPATGGFYIRPEDQARADYQKRLYEASQAEIAAKKEIDAIEKSLTAQQRIAQSIFGTSPEALAAAQERYKQRLAEFESIKAQGGPQAPTANVQAPVPMQ